MFRKKCPRCNSSINKKFEFCPYCGFSIKKSQNNEDYGMLGKDDNLEDEFNKAFQGFGGGMLNKMLGSAMKMLEKEMRKEMKNIDKNNEKMPKTNFQMYINGKKVNLDELQSDPFEKHISSSKKIRKKTQELPMPDEDIIKKSIKLPRKEAEVELKRLANKIIYEIDAPKVRKMDNVMIRKLEQGVEVKIFTKDKVLYKNLPIKLPLVAYNLQKEKLLLEFQGK